MTLLISNSYTIIKQSLNSYQVRAVPRPLLVHVMQLTRPFLLLPCKHLLKASDCHIDLLLVTLEIDFLLMVQGRF